MQLCHCVNDRDRIIIMKCILVFAAIAVACWAEDLIAQDSSSYVWPVESWPKEYKEPEPVYEYYTPERENYYDKRIGRHGLGFEKRTARASGLRMPVTADNIQSVGYRPLKKDQSLYAPL